jgi:hypothetical protein
MKTGPVLRDDAMSSVRACCALAAIAASFAWTGCSIAAPESAVRIDPGQDFSLRAGESARTRDNALQVGFDGVTADSRCPKGERCIVAGDAIARVWLQQGSGPRETRDLRASAGAAPSARVLGQVVRLVRLDPVAIGGKAIAKADYVITLNVNRAPEQEADR